MKTHRSPQLVAAIALALAGGLSACSDSNKTAGQKVDDVMASTERKAAEVKADIKQGAVEMKDTAAQTGSSAKQAVSDAAITTAVNAELVKDATLSALKINVDTHDGRVVLNGTAPDAAAKTRATQLANSISGVVSVENHLTVK